MGEALYRPDRARNEQRNCKEVVLWRSVLTELTLPGRFRFIISTLISSGHKYIGIYQVEHKSGGDRDMNKANLRDWEASNGKELSNVSSRTQMFVWYQFGLYSKSSREEIEAYKHDIKVYFRNVLEAGVEAQ